MEQLMQWDFFTRIPRFLQNLNLHDLTSGLQNFHLPTDEFPGTDQIADSATKVLQTITRGAFLIGLILALLGCFFGYKMLKFWISLAGFIIGAAAGYAITYQITNDSAYALIGTIVGGILLSFLSYKVYLVGVFLLAGFGAYFLSAAYLPLTGISLTAVSVIIGFIVAILAVIYMRPAIIVITGLQNGIVAAGILTQLVTFSNQSMTIPLGVGLGMIGSAFQFMTTRSRKEKKRRRMLEEN